MYRSYRAPSARDCVSSDARKVPRHDPDCLLTLGGSTIAAVDPTDLFDALTLADAATVLVMVGVPFVALCVLVVVIQIAERAPEEGE